MDEEQEVGRTVSTLDTSYQILESLVEVDGGTVTEIASCADLAKSTVHAHLKTLCKHNLVVKNGLRYDIGLQFLDFGLYARNRIEGFSTIREKAVALAAESGELVVFIVEENGEGVVLVRERGPNAVETEVRTGNRVKLHATAAGKAILAHEPREYVEHIISQHGLSPKTEKTMTTEEDFYSELNEVQSRGYAVSAEEHTDGLHTFSSPVVGSDDQIIGGLSVSGPTQRMQNEAYRTELTEMLLGAVNELELKIKYS